MVFRGVLLAVVVAASLCSWAQSPHQHHASGTTDSENQVITVSGLRVPDVELVDQHGTRVHFCSDLIKGKVVAINTIFTTCTTICPIMGANFAKLNKLLAHEGRSNLSLISISIDPAVDTPDRLSQWSSEFGGTGSGWTLLTGTKSNVQKLLRALQVFTPEKDNHSPVVLIGGDGIGSWVRADALRDPSDLARLIRARLELRQSNPPPKDAHLVRAQDKPEKEDSLSAPARQYFTDIELRTQNGDFVRFYTDLLKDKVVVVNTFFGTCRGACPMMAAVLAGVQERLGDRLGKDLFFLSFSVDPVNDTPEKLKEYAQHFHAKPGWLFVTGTPENVHFALAKLGHQEAREEHQTVFMVLNNGEGLLKVGFDARVTPDSLTQIIERALDNVRDRDNGRD